MLVQVIWGCIIHLKETSCFSCKLGRFPLETVRTTFCGFGDLRVDLHMDFQRNQASAEHMVLDFQLAGKVTESSDFQLAGKLTADFQLGWVSAGKTVPVFQLAGKVTDSVQYGVGFPAGWKSDRIMRFSSWLENYRWISS